MYGAEQIRIKLGEDLETLTVAGGRSFDLVQVDLTGEVAPDILATPAVQLLAVEGAAEEASAANAGVETLSYALDLFARPGDLPGGLERAAADVRNVIERKGSAVLQAGLKVVRVDVVGWEFIEGPDVQRSLLHQIRFRVECERLYSRGDA